MSLQNTSQMQDRQINFQIGMRGKGWVHSGGDKMKKKATHINEIYWLFNDFFIMVGSRDILPILNGLKHCSIPWVKREWLILIQNKEHLCPHGSHSSSVAETRVQMVLTNGDQKYDTLRALFKPAFRFKFGFVKWYYPKMIAITR